MRGVPRSLASLLVGLLLLGSVPGRAQERPPLALPPAQMAGDTPLMQALNARQSLRAFRPEPLPVHPLADGHKLYSEPRCIAEGSPHVSPARSSRHQDRRGGSHACDVASTAPTSVWSWVMAKHYGCPTVPSEYWAVSSQPPPRALYNANRSREILRWLCTKASSVVYKERSASSTFRKLVRPCVYRRLARSTARR
jgi:hypothetical protein